MRSGALRFGAVAAVLAVTFLLPLPTPAGTETAEATASPPMLSHAAGVAADAALDRVYLDTNSASLGRQRQMLGDCYAEDAIYLSEEFPIQRGRQTIVDGFARWWQWLDENEARVVESNARVVSRQVVGDFAYDVGYWRLVTEMADGETRTEVWKYSTVFRRGRGGKWEIQVDNNLRAPVEAFDG